MLAAFLKKLFSREEKKLIVKDNTFIVWEPCSDSHSEVVPGYVKYLLDLGYHVSVAVNPKHLKDGLFSRFSSPQISFNSLSRREIYRFFRNADLSRIKGVLVTTVGKLCKNSNYEECYDTFNASIDRKKLFFVEHKAKEAIDSGTWKKELITLRKLDYKNAASVVVNPHYFGQDIAVTGKNKEVVNFVTIGAIRSRKKNTGEMIEAVKILHDRGIRNFKVTVIGKGKLRSLPEELRQYFDIKGRLTFREMYAELEKADFLLTAYDDQNPVHLRYTKYQTSGNFQLIYGFLKPCVIIRSFAAPNGFTPGNSVIYNTKEEYAGAMEKAINMTPEDYQEMQKNLQDCVRGLYQDSLTGLREAING